MKALPVEKLPEGDWLYEIKFDGYRALAFKDGKDVRLVSRNKKAFDYPQLLDALKLLPAERVILDGEIAALDEKGRSSFQLHKLRTADTQRTSRQRMSPRVVPCQLSCDTVVFFVALC
jgi:bifunctional non-homologous end joining protein LigD